MEIRKAPSVCGALFAMEFADTTPNAFMLEYFWNKRNKGEDMTKAEAKAEIFWLAFRALTKEEQARVLNLIMGNRSLREDIIDIAIALERSREKTRPLNDILAEIGEER